MTLASQCPGCRGDQFVAQFILPDQPVVLNYRFATAIAARAVERRDMMLVQCGHCGLVFNRSFESSLVPYDRNYENRQCFSSAFQEHLKSLARNLISQHRLRDTRILEVGCGKGDFLELICSQANAFGAGYDTSYEGPESSLDGRVRYYREYVCAKDVHERYDAVICRHVVEHVPRIGDFLCELRSIVQAAGNPVVVLETPSFELIVRNGCFWDIFYEHCNYFNLSSLALLAELAGFEVLDQTLVFGGQYQLLQLRARETTLASKRSFKISDENSLGALANKIVEAQKGLEQRLLERGAQEGWAIWGAGAKGVALVNQLRITSPMFVIDSNPAKQGGVISGSGISIVAPEDPQVLQTKVILVANPNYLAEINSTLEKIGFQNTVLLT